MKSGYENLGVFQRSFAISIQVHKLSQHFPKTEQYTGIADQIRRSSKSICANIVEGYGRKRDAAQDFKRFIRIATGSATETRLWLKYCNELEYLDESLYNELDNEYLEIVKMLHGLYSSQ